MRSITAGSSILAMIFTFPPQRSHCSMSMPNTPLGRCTQLSRSCASLRPRHFSRRGVQGIRTGGLPPVVLAWTLRDCVAPVDLELAAYTQGSRVLLRELLMTDPRTRSTAQADALIDEISALPFHDELRAHYR
jgi:alpha-galactosidase/6-phospho-beta-glucosidase family protein